MEDEPAPLERAQQVVKSLRPITPSRSLLLGMSMQWKLTLRPGLHHPAQLGDEKIEVIEEFCIVADVAHVAG